MPARPRPTVRLRRLAGTLRRLRAAKGLSREYVEEATGINKATLSRIENTHVRPQARTLLALLDLYDAGDKRPALMQMLKESSQSGWWEAYGEELPERYGTYIEFENEATAVWNYESLYIPGLLQTEEYARVVIPGGMPSLTKEQADQRVKVRMERQSALDRLHLWAICDEAALHRMVGGPLVMQAQLLHLVNMMESPRITLQVVGFDVGAHPGMLGSFVVMNFADAPQVVYIDGIARDLFLEEDGDVGRYTNLFEHLRALAERPETTRQLLIRVANEYAQRVEQE